MVFPGVAVLADDAEATEEKRAQVETGPSASEPACGVSATCSYLKPSGDFLGSPVVETLRLHCRGHGFGP